jgi:hypothetical protein
MATSSIFADVVIADPEKAERFVELLDASSREAEWKPTMPVKPLLTDVDAIRKLMAKRIQNRE